MKLKSLIVGPLEANCYVVWDEKAKEAICIDPGGDVEEILTIIEKAGLSLKYIINTHGHFDHVGANRLLKKTTGAKIAIHKEDAILLEHILEQGIAFGIQAASSPAPDMFLNEKDEIRIGNLTISVIHTPGHTKGGICLLLKDSDNGQKIMFTGDTIFADSVGRTDLPGGSHKELIDSIKKKILRFEDDMKLYPGHGPQTTIGREKRFNQFLVDV